MLAISRIDRDKEENGVFVDLPLDYIGEAPDDESKWPALKIAKWQNSAHQKAAIEIRKKRFPRRSIDDLSGDESMALLREIMASTIVLDWRNIADIEGNEVPYSQADCQRWMEDDRDLMTWIMEEAQKREHYYRARVGNSKKKSAATSATS